MSNKNTKEFLNKNNLKKVNKKLNENVDRYGWNSKGSTIQVEHSTFNHATHLVGYGLNGDTQVVSFENRILEAKEILLARSEYSQTHLTVYLKTVSSSRRFKQEQTYWSIRNKKNGKVVSRDKIDLDTISFVFGRSPIMPELVMESEIEANGSVLLFKQPKDDWQLERERVERFYKESFDRIYYNYDNALSDLCESQGYSLIQEFEYNESFSFTPEYVYETSKYLEFGYQTNFTYYSHPNTLRISKPKEIKTVKLQDLGTEVSGYYDHHIKMRCLPEQVDLIKSFTKKYQAKRRSK